MDFYTFALTAMEKFPLTSWFAIFWSGVVMITVVQAIAMIAHRILNKEERK